MPHLIIGILLVVSCTGAGVLWSVNAGQRRPALALARPVTLGATLASADLREVSVAVDGLVDAIPAAEASAVVGKTLSVSLPAGVLLPRGVLGDPPSPARGRAVVAVALEPGQAPQGLAAGARVLVVRTTDPNTPPSGPNTGTTSRASWPGLVIHVATTPDGQRRVVSLELREDDARSVAAEPVGGVAVVLVGGGDR